MSISNDEPLVVREASSIAPSESSNLLQRLMSEGVNAWTVILHLSTTSHGGVRDYLINRMYELNSEHVDFFLPQLCCFLVSWPADDRVALERFMLDKCSKSLHCAMKMFWLLQAMAPYCSAADQSSRCSELASTCETVVINSCRPKFLGQMGPHLKAIGGYNRRLDQLLIRNKAILNRINNLFERIDPLTDPSPRNSNTLSVFVRSHSQDSFMVVDGHHRPSILSSASAPSDNRSISPTPKRRHSRFWANLNNPDLTDHADAVQQKTESLLHQRHSLTAGPFSRPSESGPTIRDFDVFLAKEQMAEFFTSQLHLIGALEEISTDLVKIDPPHRKISLQRMLAVLNGRACRGLYFPNCQASDPHYVILRIITQESMPLSSRDKVPFLMPVEVMYTSHDCSGDVHKEYFVDHDACREYLLELMDAPADELAATNPHQIPFKLPTSKFGYPFGELLSDRKARVRSTSPFGRLNRWDLKLMIFKSGDDCRQEHLAMQMITYMDDMFRDAQIPLRLRPFEVLVSSATSGLIECVPNSKSIDALKKSIPDFQSLLWFFENHFGPRGSAEFAIAQRNFVESMAAYSLLSFLLQIKDRHNGNILLTSEGHIVHIDFGFMLSNSPGGNMNFERAPFKLTQEFIEVMEGEDSESFHLYRLLMIRGFLQLRQHCDRIVCLAEILFKGPPHDCFYGGPAALQEFRDRFHANDSEQVAVEFVYSLVSQSINNWRSVQYDTYQRITNGIL